MVARRAGTTLIELIIALTIFCTGLLGLAAVAALGQRSLAQAARSQRAADLASEVLDSLAWCTVIPADGERSVGDLRIRWTVERDTGLVLVRAVVLAQDGAELNTFSMLRDASPH